MFSGTRKLFTTILLIISYYYIIWSRHESKTYILTLLDPCVKHKYIRINKILLFVLLKHYL